MLRVIFILCLVLSPICLWGQTSHVKTSQEYFLEGNLEKAFEVEVQNLMNIERSQGKRNPDFVESLRLLSIFDYFGGNFKEAIEFATEALGIAEKIYGRESAEYAVILANIAMYYEKMQDYPEAIRNITEALEIREKVLGKTNPIYIANFESLALYNYDSGNHQEALQLGLELLKMRESQAGKKSPDYARALNHVGTFYYKLGNDQEAYRYLTEALKINEEVLGRNHPEFATNLNNLASYYSSAGNYQEAVRLETEALSIIEKVYGKNHPNYAMSLGNLALYYSQLGNYSDAIRLGTESLQITEIFFGKNHIGYAVALSSLAQTYSNFGNFKESIRLEKEALKILEEIEGKHSYHYATSLSRLSIYYAGIRNYVEAIIQGTEALNIIADIMGNNNSSYVSALSNLANYHSYLGNYDQAIRLSMDVLKIKEDILGKRHPDYAISLGNLARYYASKGNYKDAINLEKESLKINEDILGRIHPANAESLRNLSFYYLNTGDIDSLKEAVSEAYSLNNDILTSSFQFLPASERGYYWDANKLLFTSFIPEYCFLLDDKDLTSLGYNSALLSKGILLNSEIEFDRFLADTGNAELTGKYNEIKNIRLEINKLYEKPVAERWCDTDSLERVAANLERNLMSRSKEFGDYTRNLSITWQDVQKRLKNRDVAIEFVLTTLHTGQTVYLAYVLRPDMESPALVRLFEEKELTSLFSPDSPYLIYDNKEKAGNLVWDKLRPFVEDCENIYFAPDGILHQIAIEYLPDFDGYSLISDRYNLHRLSSTRQLAAERKGRERDSAVVYGGIVYDNDIASMQVESRKYRQRDDQASRSETASYGLVESLDGRLGISYLEGTLKEAELIKKALEKKKYKAQLITGQNASEESFKYLSGKNTGIIHIGTHGFYWKEEEADKTAPSNALFPFMSESDNSRQQSAEDKALTRSGLLMAGAQNTLQGRELPEGVDDGLLTALEIAQLNLRNTDLVVLSACQTGMGDISGDGVFGLQRGFKKAGVNSLLMSLWNVDDDATQMLMSEFFQYLMKGLTKQESLRNARQAVRSFSGMINGHYRDFSDPKYWGAFILLDALD